MSVDTTTALSIADTAVEIATNARREAQRAAMADADITELNWIAPERDKYGRPATRLTRTYWDTSGDRSLYIGCDWDLAVVVTLPKGCEPRYLVNVRAAHNSSDYRGTVTYHNTRNAAKAYAAANLPA